MQEFLEKEEFLSFSSTLSVEERSIEEAKVRFSTKRSEKKFFNPVQSVLHILCTLDVHWSELPDGTIHGECISFYEEGSEASRCNVVNGKIEGRYIMKRRQGKILAEIDFMDGKIHGYYTTWTSDGRLYQRCTFVKGIILEWEEGWNKLGCGTNYIYSPPKQGKSGFCVSKNFSNCGQLHTHGRYVCEGEAQSSKMLVIPMVNCAFDSTYKMFGVDEIWNIFGGNYTIIERTEYVDGETTNMTNWRRDGSLEITWSSSGGGRNWP